MGEKLTCGEIKRRYPDEYVILVDVDADDETDEVRGGVVFDHSTDRKKLLATTKDALVGQDTALLFTSQVGRGNYLF